MRNAAIADAFTELADRLALTDLKPYRYMAYRKAATLFGELGDSVAVLSEEGRLLDLEGVGPAIDEKVRALLATGTFPALEEAREAVPDTLLELTRLPGVGPATAKKVYAAADGQSFEALLDQAASGTLEVGNGITKAVVDALAARAEQRAAGGAIDAGSLSGVPRDDAGEPLPGPWFRRDQACSLAETVVELLGDEVQDVGVRGAYARGCELVDELVLVATAPGDCAPVAASLADNLGSRGWELPSGDAPRSELLDGISTDAVADLHLVSPAGFPVLLALATPAARALADHRLTGPAAWVVREPEPASDSVPVELRDRVLAGDIDPAVIPEDLVTEADLRGELHAHSDWSDGRAPIIEMARAARARGDEYFCVTDHSAPYAMVNGLDPDRLAAQAEEIAAANETLAAEHAAGAPPFRVLRGSEVEILADGSLGLPDSALERLDWVVASLHSQQRQDAATVLERMRGVLENPLVDAIGHPTSRRLLKRERTALDVERLVQLAAEHDVVLEINANPDRLDLDSTHAALALAAGVRLTVNTDAHRPGTLDLRQHGVAVARRAAARKADVVNCLPVEELLASRRRHR